MIRGRKDLEEALLQNAALPDDIRDWIKYGRMPTRGPSEPTLTVAPTPVDVTAVPAEGEEATRAAEQRETLLQRIGRMTAAEKIALALKGNQEERLVLIRDSNKVVARAVLQSPKVTDAEIEAFASMKNVTEEVLRLISTSRQYMKNYGVVRSLINNPRSPIDVALPLLNRMNDRDLKALMNNKNVAEVLRSMATKMVKQKTEAHKPKGYGKH